MHRREFITLFGSAAAWPLAARAQQGDLLVIGVLYGGTVDGMAPQLASFRRTLNEAGYLEGRDIEIDYRVADNRIERLPAMAMDLVQRHAAAIYVAGGTAAALAAKTATLTIPIVFGSGTDPVALGLVESLNRPGGNMTGVTVMSDALRSKQVELLRRIAPRAAAFAFLANPATARTKDDVSDMETAARTLGWEINVFNARTENDFEAAFAAMEEQRITALLLQDTALFNSHPESLAALAARARVPTLALYREFPSAGGLMSYGASRTDQGRQLGTYIVRIIKGEKAGDLPVMQSSTFEFVLNLKTAKALDLIIPEQVLALADEVIE